MCNVEAHARGCIHIASSPILGVSARKPRNADGCVVACERAAGAGCPLHAGCTPFRASTQVAVRLHGPACVLTDLPSISRSAVRSTLYRRSSGCVWLCTEQRVFRSLWSTPPPRPLSKPRLAIRGESGCSAAYPPHCLGEAGPARGQWMEGELRVSRPSPRVAGARSQ